MDGFARDAPHGDAGTGRLPADRPTSMRRGGGHDIARIAQLRDRTAAPQHRTGRSTDARPAALRSLRRPGQSPDA
jgi:hypothetical protein